MQDLPKLRRGIAHLWDLYIDLHNATGGNVTYQEIAAYSHFNGDLTPFEVDAIREINQQYLRAKNG